MELPFKMVRAKASAPPGEKRYREFCARLEGTLRPFFKRLGQTVSVGRLTVHGLTEDCPFSVVPSE